MVGFFTYMALGGGYGFAAAVQPGPFQTFVISRTLQNGWRRTLPAALAPLLTDGPIVAVVLFVLTRVPAWFVSVLYLAGGAFIAYLAVNAGLAFRNFDLNREPDKDKEKDRDKDKDKASGTLWRAAVLNALSPGPYLYWSLVTGPILVSAYREHPAAAFGFAGGFYGAMIGSLVALIVVFGVARKMGPRVNRALVGISALALLGFGGYQIWLGIRALT